MTSSDHFSPTTERAAATEHGRTDVVSMGPVWHKWVDFSN
jgi:hypothetical protein